MPTLGLHNQDLRIATEAWEQGCGLIVAGEQVGPGRGEGRQHRARAARRTLIAKAPFLQYVPFVYVSALTGQRARKVLDLILEVAEAREQRIPTAEVNKVLASLLDRSAPPQKPGEEVKLLYASQIGTAPPTFAIVSNRPRDVPRVATSATWRTASARPGRSPGRRSASSSPAGARRR